MRAAPLLLLAAGCAKAGCPGGSLPACIHECPDSPPAVHTACVVDCGQKCPSGPPAPPAGLLTRDEHTAVLAGDAVAITGGWSSDTDDHGGYLNDTWVLDLTTLAWTPLGLRMPPTISAHVAVLVPKTGDSPVDGPYQLTYGGNNGGAAAKLRAGARSGDAANFDSRVFLAPAGAAAAGGTWKELNSGEAPAGPGKRVRPAAVSRRAGELTIHGGWPGPDGDNYATMLQDVWQYSMADNKWSDITPSNGAAPANRYHHVAVYDAKADEMIVHGGYALVGRSQKLVHYADTWHYSFASASWREGSTRKGAFLPPARMGHTAVWDAAEAAMVVFGGNTGTANIADVWVYRPGSPGTWTEVNVTSAEEPLGRNCATASLPTPGRMVVVGGEGAGTLIDVWELTSTDGYRTAAWKRLL